MIDTQVLKCNLIRQDYATAFMLNQGDKGVPFKIELIDNGTPYTLLKDDIVTIEWLKPNGSAYLQEGNIKYGTNYIEFTTPEAIAQHSGSGSFNIIITNNNARKGTIRREYKVVPTSMRPGTTSEDTITDAITELRSLSSEIASTVQNNQELIGNNQAATKSDITNVSSQLEEIANKGTTVEVLERVTKEEVDRQVADGTIANLTIADNSIKMDKIHASLLERIEETKINCDSELITYGGAWQITTSEYNYLGNSKYTSTADATFKFTVVGATKVEIMSTLSNNKGDVYVYLNGALYDTYNCYNDTTVYGCSVATIELDGGTNTIRCVIKTSDKNITGFTLDYISIWGINTLDMINTQVNPNLLKTYERTEITSYGDTITADDASIVQEGTWTVRDMADSPYGKIIFCNGKGDKISIPFYGVGVEIWDVTDLPRGLIRVEIDGNTFNVINRSMCRNYEKIVIDGLTLGDHTLSIVSLSEATENFDIRFALTCVKPILEYKKVEESIDAIRPRNIKDNTPLKFWIGTQTEYDALVKDNNTLYFIKE